MQPYYTHKTPNLVAMMRPPVHRLHDIVRLLGAYLTTAHVALCRNSAETSQPVSWRPIGDTQLTLTKQYPLNGGNKIAMRLDADSGAGGIINTGFWGISVAAGKRYELSLYLRKAQPSSVSPGPLPVGLLL